MSEVSGVEEILHQGERLEKEYDWLGSAESYEKALDLLPQDDFLRMREIHERLGYAFYRAAFQSESNNEFEQMMRRAVEEFEKTRQFSRKMSGAKMPRGARCDAMISYIHYWLAMDAPERKNMLDECLGTEKEALKTYEENGDKLGIGETCIELAEFLSDRLDLELDIRIRETILNEALNLGEKAIRIFSEAGNEQELAKAYCIASVNCYDAAMSLRSEAKRKECEQRAFEYAKETIKISEKIGDKYLLSRSTSCLGSIEIDLGGGVEVGADLLKKALQYCNETNDHRIMSEAFDGLAFSTSFSLFLVEDLEVFREKSRKCQEHASKAINYNIRVNCSRGIFHSYAYGYVANLSALASTETKLEARRELLNKAATFGKEGLEHAQRLGSTHAIFHVSSELARTLYDLSTMHTGAEKRQLLVEAMTLGEKAIHYTEQLRPTYALPQSLPYEALALMMLELSKLEERKEKRRELLEEAVSRMETCIGLLQKHVVSFPSRRELFAVLGRFQTELGSILDQLYQVTAEKEALGKLAETYQSAAQSNRKAELASRVAEAYWHSAVIYDRLGQYLESSHNFESASKEYELSAQNTPQLNSFYTEYAAYMEAWSWVEKAKHNHERDEYGHSRDCYEKAATALNSSKSWAYLVPNYSAWAYLEQAEDLSRNDKSEEAIHAFTEAATLFSQARKSLEARSEGMTSAKEKEMALKLIEASNIREEYCLARIFIEEAKNLYTSGDCVSSAEKYGLAAEKLDRIAQIIEIEAELKDLHPMIHMCQAWQKMSVADEMSDATLYAEASALFAKVKESSVKKRTAMLAAGNSSMCKALELGAKYKSTRNVILYYEAKHYMESASDYYMDAGFGNESTWVNATEALFDAYFYMGKAETEADHRDKTKFYGLVEGYLDRSGKLFNKAGYTKKAGDVLKTLERVKDKREFALSLDNVLVAPAVTSSTASITAPTPSHEEAVGLERFEHADIQANLVLNAREVKVGEDLSMRIDLVNAGKGYALLIKVEEIAPQGFEVKEAPELYRIEDSCLNMRGKRLSPLKTEEVKLTLKPMTRGVFPVKPRILYLDETGKYKFHEPEPVTITVKELGIKGWLKGER
jgi:tetratricopeptide (TPR) repeat protein